MLTEETVKGMLVAELKAELKNRDASVAGKKAELCERLVTLIKEENNGDWNEDNDNSSGNNAVDNAIDSNNDNNAIDSNNDNKHNNTVDNNANNNNAEVVNEQSNDKNEQVDNDDVTQKDAEAENSNNDNNNNDDIQYLKSRLKEKLTNRSGSSSTNNNDGNKCTVRIDNFQRPLILKNLILWLEELNAITISKDDIWINSIKTHCYLDVGTADQANTVINNVTGKKYPDNAINTKLLTACLTDVTAKEAPSSTEGRMLPDEYKEWKVNGGDSIAKSKSIDNEERTSPRRSMVAGAGLFKRAAAILGQNITVLPGGGGFATKRHREEMVSSDNTLKRRSSDINVDSLFKKTSTKPHIYWKPLTKEEADEAAVLRTKKL